MAVLGFFKGLQPTIGTLASMPTSSFEAFAGEAYNPLRESVIASLKEYAGSRKKKPNHDQSISKEVVLKPTNIAAVDLSDSLALSKHCNVSIPSNKFYPPVETRAALAVPPESKIEHSGSSKIIPAGNWTAAIKSFENLLVEEYRSESLEQLRKMPFVSLLNTRSVLQEVQDLIEARIRQLRPILRDESSK